jgi:hypothetical protein
LATWPAVPGSSTSGASLIWLGSSFIGLSSSVFLLIASLT